MTAAVPSSDESSSLADIIGTLLSPSRDLAAVAPRLRGKRVLLRADLNLPLSADNSVVDTSRLDGVLPTLRLLVAAGAKVRLQLLVVSHLGRPSPKTQSREEMVAEFSLAPVATLLREALGSDTFKGLAPDCIGGEVEEAAAQLLDGEVLLLENTRFHAGDTANDDVFARALASLADVYVNDAFGVCHRDQASVTGVARYVPECYPGPLVHAEIKYLMQYMAEPVRPLGVIIGGSKVADKIGVLRSLIQKADTIIVGGRMAFTFLAALGTEIGKTQIEEKWLEAAREMVHTATARGVRFYLPSDILVSESLDGPVGMRVVNLSKKCCTADKPCVPAGCYGVDIGPRSCEEIAVELARCNTLFWNGPMGKYEVPEFGEGTTAVARAFAASPGSTIIGGGDSVAAINQLGVASKMTHISTGGGASLELIEGVAMPGLRSLAAGGPQQPSAQ